MKYRMTFRNMMATSREDKCALQKACATGIVLGCLALGVSFPALASEHENTCFADVRNEVVDVPWKQQDSVARISSKDIVALQNKWFKLARQKNHQSLYNLTTPHFRVIRIRPGGDREVDLREEYFLNLALWFARGGVLVSLKRENESIQVSRNGNWAVYEADIWQTGRTGNRLVKIKYREKSYITFHNGHAKYAAFCARYRKVLPLPTQECGKSI